MSWWKKSDIENFEDRNIVNDKIDKLISLMELLNISSKMIYQTARGTKKMVSQIRRNKVLTSYPQINDILLKADRIALDNPHKFSMYCKEVVLKINDIIASLEHERKKFTKEKLPTRLKGFAKDE